MHILILSLLLAVELVFCIFTARRGADSREASRGRLIADAAELLIFLVFLITPSVSLDMRFGALFFLLLLRVAVRGILMLAGRNREPKAVGTGSAVRRCVFQIVLLAFAALPAFLFTDYEGLPTTGGYGVLRAETILTDGSRAEEHESDGSSREVPAYFFYPDAAAGEHFPLVVFSHGAFGYYQSNMSTYMELASNGYVVVSLEHPYHSLFTHDTNGKLIIADPGFLREVMLVQDSTDVPEEDIAKLSGKWLKLRADDMNFAVDTILAAAEDGGAASGLTDGGSEVLGRALSMIDPSRIGLMGHSLGGAASVSLGRTRSDVGAVIDIDGTMLGEIEGVENGQDILNEEPYGVPLLTFDNERHHEDRMTCLAEQIPYANNEVLSHAVHGYETCIRNTGHMNYTDLPLFSPFLAKRLGTGSVDPEACVRKMNEITLSFFNAWLKGEGEFSVEEYYELP